MRRREFIAGLAGAAAWSRAARAQQAGSVRRVGVLMGYVATETLGQSYLAAFIQGLRQSGWTESQNLRVDVRWNPGDPGLARTYAAQLIGLMPDVILADTTLNLTEIRQATSTVPVVFVEVADPVTQGFVPSVRQPGGIITGLSLLEFSLGGKWIELLKQVRPGLTRVAIMSNPDTLFPKFFVQAINAAAPSLGVEVSTLPVRVTVDIESALASFASAPNGGLVLTADPYINLHQVLVAEFARRYRLPSISPSPEFAKDGGLMSYGPSSQDAQFRQAAIYVDRILKGATPGDLPVQAPSRYTLAINLKTAKALGLTVPDKMLAVADAVIE
jgi:putative tryptophan/tyrosine transport system substrate-binding protein